MSMKKTKDIPLLKKETYAKAYFKHAPQSPSISKLSAFNYFEIHNRCLWTDLIEAHRLDFYMIFLVTEGAGKQSLGVNDYSVGKNTIGFVGPNVINSWVSETKEQRGYFCAFSGDFYQTTWENKHFLCRLPFFQIDGKATLELSESQMKFYQGLFQIMDEEYKAEGPSSAGVVRGILHALLHKANADFQACYISPDPVQPSALRLLKAFNALIMNDINLIKEGKPIPHRRISEYAEKLAVSANHLNDTVKRLSGYSASQLIKNQLIKQATMCLVRSEKSVAEISYLLGFEDSSYFSRFYRLQTGSSPSDYRNKTGEKYPSIRSLS